MVEKQLRSWQIRIFCLCWLAYASVYFGRVNLSVALPALQAQFDYTKMQLGIVGTFFFWIYGIGQLVNGYVGDHISSRALVFTGLFVTGLVNLLFGLTKSLTAMILFWAVNGYFQSMLWGPIVRTLSNWYPLQVRSRTAISISTSMVGGYLLAWGMSGYILAIADWRYVFWVPGVFVLAFSTIWLLLMRSHPHDVGLQIPGDESDAPIPTEGSTPSWGFWQVVQHTRLWFVVIACFAQGMVKDGIALWGPTLLMETQGLEITAAANLVVFIPLMNFAGILMAGWLNQHIGHQEKLAIAILLLASIGTILGLGRAESFGPVPGMILLGASSALMYGTNTLLLGVIPMGFARYNKVSTIAGFLDFCSYLAAGLGASITGLVVDSQGWKGIFILWIAASILGAASIYVSWHNDQLNIERIKAPS